jgi:hypothetical protein
MRKDMFDFAGDKDRRRKRVFKKKSAISNSLIFV